MLQIKGYVRGGVVVARPRRGVSCGPRWLIKGVRRRVNKKEESRGALVELGSETNSDSGALLSSRQPVPIEGVRF